MTITARELNRATLARQLLLHRESLGIADAVRRVVALQAQNAASPYIALWNRIQGLDPNDLDAAFAGQRFGPASVADLAQFADGPVRKGDAALRLRGSRRLPRQAPATQVALSGGSPTAGTVLLASDRASPKYATLGCASGGLLLVSRNTQPKVAYNRGDTAMIPSVIEREILIEAPVQTVWGVVTEPAQISRWFSDAAEIDLRPGGEGTLTFEMRATNERATVRLLVETAEPPHTFAFRWDYPAGATAHEGNSTRVEFTLTAEGENTRLRVTESGFPKLERPEEEKAAYADAHGKGWDIHLASLRDYVSGQS